MTGQVRKQQPEPCNPGCRIKQCLIQYGHETRHPLRARGQVVLHDPANVGVVAGRSRALGALLDDNQPIRGCERVAAVDGELDDRARAECRALDVSEALIDRVRDNDVGSSPMLRNVIV